MLAQAKKVAAVRKVFYIGAVTAALLLPAFASAGAAVKPRFSLTLQVIGPGTVVASPGTRCAGYLTRVHLCRNVYAAGTRVKLTALPKVDAKLSSWRGSLAGAGLTRTVTMNAPKVITATFAKVPPTRPPPPPPPPPPPAVGSRSNPLPLGQPLDVLEGSGEHWTLRFISTQPDATAAVLAANQFNDPPAPGNQFFLASVEAHYVSGVAARNPTIVAWDLMTVGPANVVYSVFGSSSRCGVVPDDLLFKGDLLPGGSMVGNICWQVPSSEAGSLIAFIQLDQKPFYMALR
jgi:hypothetical protein